MKEEKKHILIIDDETKNLQESIMLLEKQFKHNVFQYQ